MKDPYIVIVKAIRKMQDALYPRPEERQAQIDYLISQGRNARFVDCNFDSLDIIEMVLYVENEFSISIPDDSIVKCETIGQLEDLVIELLKYK